MHALALRQLRRFFKGSPPDSPQFTALLQAVSDAYDANDEDRALLERTLELASKETEDRYHALQRDVERREQAENERDAFFRTSPDLLSIIDHELRVVQANDSWFRVLGYPVAQVVNTNYLSTVHPEDLERVKQQVETVAVSGSVRDLEFRQRAAGGEYRWISSSVTYDANRGLSFAVGREITAQREMARELAQAQKLEAVGQLASGVAHEINTPVQYVSDNLRFAADGFSDLFTYVEAVQAVLTPPQQATLADATRKAELDYLREEVPRSLSDAKDGVRRVAELVRALKEFAHPDQAEKAPADLNKALERASVLARGELKHVSKVELQLGVLPPVSCHVGSLSQVFLNLLINAAHAVEERTQKSGVPMSEHRIVVTSRVEGAEVVISISDTGCGIPDAIRARIFEPFFTTKPMGKGSGQGLPLVRNVVLGRHGGRVEVESVVNVGTTFTLRLPIGASPGLAKAA